MSGENIVNTKSVKNFMDVIVALRRIAAKLTVNNMQDGCQERQKISSVATDTPSSVPEMVETSISLSNDKLSSFF